MPTPLSLFNPVLLLNLTHQQLSDEARATGSDLGVIVPEELNQPFRGNQPSLLAILLLLGQRALHDKNKERPVTLSVQRLLGERSANLRFSVSACSHDPDQQAPGLVIPNPEDPELFCAATLLSRMETHLLLEFLPTFGPSLCFQIPAEVIESDNSLLLSSPEQQGALPAGLPASMPGLDVRTGLRRLMNEHHLYLKLLSRFHKDFAGSASQIRAALDSGDTAAAQRQAHALKGVAGNLGATTTYETASALENCLRASCPESKQLAVRLEQELNTTMQSISGLISKSPDKPEPMEIRSPAEIGRRIGRLLECLNRGRFDAVRHTDQLPALLERVADKDEIDQLQQMIARFDFKEAYERLSQLYPISHNKAQQTQEPVARERERILIVDDMPANLLLLGKLFETELDVFVARSGEEALELGQAISPDIILLDIQLPGIDGYTTCHEFRELDATRNAPVIFVSSLADLANEERGLLLGAADYVTKPFHLSIIRARVHTHLELKRKNDQLGRLALIDALTGLPNRRSFDETLDKEWNRAQRHGEGLGLIMLDVDFFKRFNDSYGHRKGDECLARVAKTISGALSRSSDYAGRYGGEEFVVLLPSATEEEVKAIAERIRAHVQELAIPHASSEVADSVTVSLGALLFDNTEPGSSEKLVDQADHLLYRAKEQGRNQVCFSLAS